MSPMPVGVPHVPHTMKSLVEIQKLLLEADDSLALFYQTSAIEEIRSHVIDAANCIDDYLDAESDSVESSLHRKDR